MANLRDIQRRINSVRSTMQITRTMEMVSTAKIRSALERAQEADPYKDALTRMLANVSGSASALVGQPLLAVHKEEKRVLFILVASDRGLAGGFNIVPQREVAARIEELGAKGVECELITCGRKPTEFFKYRGITPVLSFEGISSNPTVDEADRIASYIMDAYVNGSIDRVMLYYHHAKNRVEQVQVIEQVLPVKQDDLKLPTSPRAAKEGMQPIEPVVPAEYEFEPSANEVLGYLIPTYIRTIVHHALLDSAAAEHAARRAAMQSATDNAKEVITSLSRTYNRERQGSITTELNEIIAGASALEDN
ncbi:MAG: ATP synthase F1 subunit gamma [Atopobiaceae bacterium]|nr:ATP synthase F1 subunit gamma [Atopobiaceae bacterium]